MPGPQPSHRAGKAGRLFVADGFDVWVWREGESVEVGAPSSGAGIAHRAAYSGGGRRLGFVQQTCNTSRSSSLQARLSPSAAEASERVGNRHCPS